MTKKTKLLFGFLLVSTPLGAADHPSKKLYDTKCASCHGKDLKGNAAMAKVFKVEPAVLDLTSAATAAKSDEELMTITTKGLRKMPAYEKSFKPAEIKGLIDYIRSVTPKVEAKEKAADKK